MLNTLPSNSVGNGASSSSSSGTTGLHYSFPKVPDPVINDGYVISAPNRVPHPGTNIDNVGLPVVFGTGSNGHYYGYLGTTQVWNVQAVDLNAACDGFLGTQVCWYDNVNGQLWIFALDTAASPNTLYTAYITVETGVLTNVGNVTLTTQPTDANGYGTVNVYRPTASAGNFTFRFSDRTIIIDDADGSEVSNVAQNNSTAGLNAGLYSSADGTISVYRIASNSGRSIITLAYNGENIIVPCPTPTIISITATIYFIPWGDKVKAVANANGVGADNLKTFNRTEFDIWLRRLLNLGGVQL